MNQRLLFLSGHLSGLLLGAALVWTYCANQTASLRSTAAPIAPQNAVVLPVNHQEFSHWPHAGQIPEGWELRYYNGLPYYLIPIDEQARAISI